MNGNTSRLGYVRAMAVAPVVRPADTVFNSLGIIEAIKKAERENVQILVTPELSITAYTCADLFFQSQLMEKAEEAVKKILSLSSPVLTAVGCPVMAFGRRFNCAVLIQNGHIKGVVPKTHIPNYAEFYEKRWFESGKCYKKSEIEYCGEKVPFGTDLLFRIGNATVGVEICEDLWVPEPPSGKMAMAGADVILNLSASDELIGKHTYLKTLISQQSARCRCAYVYASAGWGESSTDLVFAGSAIIAEDGKVYEAEERFNCDSLWLIKELDIEKLKLDRSKFSSFFDDYGATEDFRIIECDETELQSSPAIPKTIETSETGEIQESIKTPVTVDVNPYPFIPSGGEALDERCEEIANIQAYGLMKRLAAIGCKKTVIGISGGLDSTLALLVTVRAFDKLGLDRKGIIGITMPGMATTSRTKSNATTLMALLGVTSLEIPIGEAVTLHFNDIGQDAESYDVTFENSQARERTQILMDVANKENAIVIGTGDMSELALGWCTYNGDQMSMYGVNAAIPKTLVKYLVRWFATQAGGDIQKTLDDIIDTPISPELVPSGNDDIAQKTEDLVGPYELHDFFLYQFLRNSFSPQKILLLAKTAFKDKYDEGTIEKWLKTFYRRFFSQQFKRSCMPDGPKVGSVCLSPRGDWRMPSDASSSIWLNELP